MPTVSMTKSSVFLFSDAKHTDRLLITQVTHHRVESVAMPEAAATSGSPCLKNKVIGCKNELKANGNQKERAVCNACFQCFCSHSKAPLYT